MSTFYCPSCDDTYQPHWRDPDGTSLCRTCSARKAGACVWPDHPGHLSEHPCSYGTEQPGEPCRWCARPVSDDGMCRSCWVSLDDLPFADVKAIFAGSYMDLDLQPREENDPS